MSRAKAWVFTLNNPLDTEEKELPGSVEGDIVTYICWGRETGEEGTPHLQGYLETEQRIRLPGLKKIEGLQRAHFEVRRGTQEQAIVYCRKDGDFLEFGTKCVVSRGRRSDLQSFKESVDEGDTEIEVAEKHFGVWGSHPELYHRYRRLRAEKLSREVRVVFLWGEPGTGKTRGVFESYPDVWINSDPTLQWFDGYNGEETVLLDDYRGGASDAFILKVLDRYPLQVPVKGGFRPWLPTTIFISSNADPRTIHCAVGAAFLRRIETIHHLAGNLYAAGCESQLGVYLRILAPLARADAEEREGED